MKNWWTRCLCLLVVVTTMIPATGCAKKKITVKMPEDISITEEDVCLEDGALVVKNQLLLVTNPDTNYKRVEKMVRSAGGEIIGYISFSGDYQISFPEEKNAEQLQQIMEIWSTEEFVESVSCNQVSVMEEASVDYTNDSWLDNSDDAKWPQNTLWDEENPGGMNWWAEAIGMPSVWAMDGWENLKRDPVKIGVFDTVFAEQHEDLDQVIVKTWQNNTVDVDSRDHGSHVSGLIAAEVGNGVGIAGVASCVKPELYCFAAAGNADHTYTSLMIYKYAMALMFQEGVKLINISMGPANATVFAAQKENRQARDFITDGNAELARFLRKALDAGYEFLIVKSAGNTSGYEFVKCDVSKEAPYGYRLAKEGDKKKARLSQSCSAEYTWFAAIDDPAVRERVLIVGAAGLGDASAAKSGKKYTPAYFSNYGCDLYAPGVDILSLGYGEQTTELMDGTSMSTPIVSGIAGLVWHINPDLSGKHVADIVRASTDKTVSDPTAGFANAAAAVELAKRIRAEAENNTDAPSWVMGSVFYQSVQDGKTIDNEITGATAQIYESGEFVQEIHLGKESNFEWILPAGIYSVEFQVDGYIHHTAAFELQENDIQYLSVCLRPEDAQTPEKPENPKKEESNLYEGILQMFRINLANGWGDRDGENWKDVYDPDSTSLMYVLAPDLYNPESVGYVIEDLNGDGTDELVISSFYLAQEGQILDLYSVQNNQVVHLAVGGEREYYSVAQDNTIIYTGSGGAAMSLNANYRIDSKAGKLAVNSAVICDVLTDSENPWFYTEREIMNPGTGEINYSGMEKITEDEANQIIARMPDARALTLTPLGTDSPEKQEDKQNTRKDSTLQEEYQRILEEHRALRAQGYLSDGGYAGDDYDLAYTLYDIDKDGLCELIVREDLFMYYIYSRFEDFVCLLDDEFWNYYDCLYEYDGNGIIVHDGGIGSLHLEYVWLYSIDGANFVFTDTLVSSEEEPMKAIYDFLGKLKPVEPFRDIRDLSLLLEKV